MLLSHLWLQLSQFEYGAYMINLMTVAEGAIFWVVFAPILLSIKDRIVQAEFIEQSVMFWIVKNIADLISKQEYNISV